MKLMRLPPNKAVHRGHVDKNLGCESTGGQISRGSPRLANKETEAPERGSDLPKRTRKFPPKTTRSEFLKTIQIQSSNMSFEFVVYMHNSSTNLWERSLSRPVR